MLLRDVGLIGPHNRENILPAALVGKLLGIPNDAIINAITSFKGLPHRLERCGSLKGTDWYNDSFSTTPETTIAALNSFDRPIILIAGGSNKGSDYTELGEAIIKNRLIKSVILMGDTADQIADAINKAARRRKRAIPLEVIKTAGYAEAFMTAYLQATSGDVVLLSPACASFGLFENYKDRGDKFKAFIAANK